MLFVAFDIVHSEILCEQRSCLKTRPFVHGLSSKSCNFLPYLQMSKNLRRDCARGERWILGSRTSKIVSDGSCPLLRADEKFVLSSGVARSGGPDWIRTSDPLLIKEVL